MRKDAGGWKQLIESKRTSFGEIESKYVIMQQRTNSPLRNKQNAPNAQLHTNTPRHNYYNAATVHAFADPLDQMEAAKGTVQSTKSPGCLRTASKRKVKKSKQTKQTKHKNGTLEFELNNDRQ
jgi:hypothetical protein